MQSNRQLFANFVFLFDYQLFSNACYLLYDFRQLFNTKNSLKDVYLKDRTDNYVLLTAGEKCNGKYFLKKMD